MVICGLRGVFSSFIVCVFVYFLFFCCFVLCWQWSWIISHRLCDTFKTSFTLRCLVLIICVKSPKYWLPVLGLCARKTSKAQITSPDVYTCVFCRSHSVPVNHHQGWPQAVQEEIWCAVHSWRHQGLLHVSGVYVGTACFGCIVFCLMHCHVSTFSRLLEWSTWLEMEIRPQPMQVPLHTYKGGHPLQCCSLSGFLKDGLPCVCVVALAVIGTLFCVSVYATHCRSDPVLLSCFMGSHSLTVLDGKVWTESISTDLFFCREHGTPHTCCLSKSEWFLIMDSFLFFFFFFLFFFFVCIPSYRHTGEILHVTIFYFRESYILSCGVVLAKCVSSHVYNRTLDTVWWNAGVHILGLDL